MGRGVDREGCLVEQGQRSVEEGRAGCRVGRRRTHVLVCPNGPCPPRPLAARTACALPSRPALAAWRRAALLRCGCPGRHRSASPGRPGPAHHGVQALHVGPHLLVRRAVLLRRLAYHVARLGGVSVGVVQDAGGGAAVTPGAPALLQGAAGAAEQLCCRQHLTRAWSISSSPLPGWHAKLLRGQQRCSEVP